MYWMSRESISKGGNDSDIVYGHEVYKVSGMDERSI